MKTVRRLYIYAVALISVEVVLWGLINLLRSIVSQTVGGTAEVLARALALTLVGLPIFLFHWIWAQRLAASDDEERSAGLRAIFLYGMLLGTLIPLFQNLLALIDRTLLDLTRLQASRAIFGATQSATDNLIAIVVNLLVAAYFWNILRAQWPTLPRRDDFIDVRRLYRYLWVVYGLLITIFGVQQILRYLIIVPPGLLGSLTRETAINGVALLIVGAPLWFYAWSIAQQALAEPGETQSSLRLAILYILALAGVISVLTSSATVLHVLLKPVFGTRVSASALVSDIGLPLSIGLPLAAVWAYYGHWLNRHIASAADPVRQAGLRRGYVYILSALGLGGSFFGVALLFKFIIDRFAGSTLILTDALRSDLGRAIGVTVAWLPLWLLSWARVQAEAADPREIGDHARRSIVRRAYLYLALFAGVIGGMITAVAFAFELIRSALGTSSNPDILPTVLNDLQLLILFVILLVYHLTVMRRDGRFTAASLAKKQQAFRLLIFDSGEGFGEAAQRAVAAAAPNVRLTVTARTPRGKFDALIVAGSRLLAPPVWMRLFRGTRIVVPDDAPGLIWAGGMDGGAMQKAASAVRQLAEGQDVRTRRLTRGWMIVVYIAAGLFGLELIFFLFALVMSSFFG